MNGNFGSGTVPSKIQRRQTNLESPHFDPSEATIKYRKPWNKVRKKEKFAARFDENVGHLAEDMIDVLQPLEASKNTQAKDAAIDDMTSFLNDQTGENGIDSCVRSLILRKIAKKDKSKLGNADVELVKIVVKSEKLLSFETLNLKPSDIEKRDKLLPLKMKNRCDLSKYWECTNPKMSTPFHIAVANGHFSLVKHMIRGIEEHYEQEGTDYESLLETLRLKDPERIPGKTALQTAADQGSQDILKELLRHPRIAVGSENGFEAALTNGKDEIVEIFLNACADVCDFITNERIMTALNGMRKEKAGTDRWKPRMNIVRSFLRRATTSKGLSSEVIQTIIQMDLAEAWEECKKGIHDTDGLLHLAVSSQKLKFVKLFVEENPKSVITKAFVPTKGQPKATNSNPEHYPLWYNNKRWENNEWNSWNGGSPEIRTLLVTATVRQVEKMQTLSSILQQCAEKAARELCFDISQFSSKSHRVCDFIHSLILHQENKGLLSYEPTIKYASFPSLDQHADDKESFGKGPCKEESEVFYALDWLWDKKQVRSILELKVPDRLFNPHNELKIAECVHKFEVEVLNWRFLDLSLSIFEPSVKNRIRVIHLYSSGKRAAISHWLSSDGLDSFTNLSEVHIHLITEMMTRKHCEDTSRYLDKKLKAKFQKCPKYKIVSQPWNPSPSSATNLEEIAQRAFPKLSPFISSYRDYANTLKKRRPDVFRPTKVAIIDNGILSMSPEVFSNQGHVGSKKKKTDKVLQHKTLPNGKENVANNDADADAAQTDDDGNADPNQSLTSSKTLWTRIKGGYSFVDDDFQVSPWLLASDPHGTQMANLICALDPCCDLYIAKVAEGRNGITPERVSRAINWATDNNVDVISMSFSMPEKGNLEESVRTAFGKGIIMFCSSHDEGSNTLESWPANSTGTKAVVACDEYGALLRETDISNYDYKIRGENIPAGTVPFLESNDRITGSSVATATAAGLGSLMLSCARLSGKAKGQNSSIVDAYFKSMMQGDKSKYVMLEKFGGIDAKVKEGEPISALDILKSKFFIHS